MNQKANAAARLPEIRKAMNRGWKIPEEYLDELPGVLHSMATETVHNPETGFEEYEPGPVRIQAIKLIMEMKKQNIAEGLVEDGEENRPAGDVENETEVDVETRKSEILRFINKEAGSGDDSVGNRSTGSRSRKAAGKNTAAAGRKKRTTKRASK